MLVANRKQYNLVKCRLLDAKTLGVFLFEFAIFMYVISLDVGVCVCVLLLLRCFFP